jgi:ABC-type Fe3+/spermidine/putrescine transport system ATPase subunit
MTVEQNVAFGLKMRKVPKPERQERVAEALRLVRLDHLAQRKPAQLSGGQQQRVALARAIVTRPQLLLLDEPLSSLDHQIRVELRKELRRLQRDLGLTGIYVTHDHSEALALGDRIVVMKAGEVVETGEPREVFANPRFRYTAEFLSVGTILDASRTAAGDLQTPIGTVPGGAVRSIDGEVDALCLRPTSASFVTGEAPVATGSTRHAGSIVSIEFEPAGVSYGVQLSDGTVVGVFRQRAEDVELGSDVLLECDWTQAIPLLAS